jgi:hypothetical protein
MDGRLNSPPSPSEFFPTVARPCHGLLSADGHSLSLPHAVVGARRCERKFNNTRGDVTCPLGSSGQVIAEKSRQCSIIYSHLMSPMTMTCSLRAMTPWMKKEEPSA